MKKHIIARQDRNRELGRIDAKARCHFCRRELPKAGWTIRIADGKPFCNAECQADAEIVESLKVVNR